MYQTSGEKSKDYSIAFASMQLNPTEKNYTTTEQECLAMVFSIKKFRHYLLLNLVVVFVDHMAIKYLMNKTDLSDRLARWILLVEEFNYMVEYKLGRMQKQGNYFSILSNQIGEASIDDTLIDDIFFIVSTSPT